MHNRLFISASIFPYLISSFFGLFHFVSGGVVFFKEDWVVNHEDQLFIWSVLFFGFQFIIILLTFFFHKLIRPPILSLCSDKCTRNWNFNLLVGATVYFLVSMLLQLDMAYFLVGFFGKLRAFSGIITLVSIYYIFNKNKTIFIFIGLIYSLVVFIDSSSRGGLTLFVFSYIAVLLLDKKIMLSWSKLAVFCVACMILYSGFQFLESWMNAGVFEFWRFAFPFEPIVFEATARAIDVFNTSLFADTASLEFFCSFLPGIKSYFGCTSLQPFMQNVLFPQAGEGIGVPMNSSIEVIFLLNKSVVSLFLYYLLFIFFIFTALSLRAEGLFNVIIFLIFISHGYKLNRSGLQDVYYKILYDLSAVFLLFIIFYVFYSILYLGRRRNA